MFSESAVITKGRDAMNDIQRNVEEVEFDDAAMLRQQREYEEQIAGEIQVAWAARDWVMDCDGITESKTCITVYEGVFNAAVMTTVRGGDEVIEFFGPDRRSLEEAKQDVKVGVFITSLDDSCRLD